MNVVTLRATVRRTSSNMTRETGLFAVVECHTHSVLEDLMHTVQKKRNNKASFMPWPSFSRIALESTP